MMAPKRRVFQRAIFAFLLAGLLLAPAPSATSQEAEASDSLGVFLVTIGPGPAVWERFGHNALWIHDPEAGTDIAYHWGLFDMSEAGFMVEFLRGRMVYSMGAADAIRLIEAYRGVGRDVTIQELALTRAEAGELQRFVEWNVQPENRRYRYDYFRDNCSTRVRDALDQALGGAIRRELEARPAQRTYRAQAIDLTSDDVLLTTGMDLGLGPLADQPISRWELAFIPMRLRDDVGTLSVTRDGRRVPLVASERSLPARGRDVMAPADESSPVVRTLGHLGVGLFLGGLMGVGAVLGFGTEPGPRRRLGRWLVGGVGSLWGLTTGLLGLVLLGLWVLTDHEFAWSNENLLQANPLALALVVLAPLAVARGGSTGATRLAGLLLGLSLFGLFLHPLPVTPQANLAIIALALPVHLGVFYALWRAEAGPRQPASAARSAHRAGQPGQVQDASTAA